MERRERKLKGIQSISACSTIASDAINARNIPKENFHIRAIHFRESRIRKEKITISSIFIYLFILETELNKLLNIFVSLRTNYESYERSK